MYENHDQIQFDVIESLGCGLMLLDVVGCCWAWLDLVASGRLNGKNVDRFSQKTLLTQ